MTGVIPGDVMRVERTGQLGTVKEVAHWLKDPTDVTISLVVEIQKPAKVPPPPDPLTARQKMFKRITAFLGRK